MPLHTDYRPKEFGEIIGNQNIVSSLEAIFNRSSDYPHAYLFHGETGCGKTTLARIISNKLGVINPIEINSADMTGVDYARKIMAQSRFKKIGGGNRVYILDEFHRTSSNFQDAILKQLEDPPPHAYYILCTTNPDKITKTIINRCQCFAVRRLKPSEIETLIDSVLEKENAELDDKVFDEIINNAEGCPRQALVMLDQVIDMDGEDALGVVKNIKIEETTIRELCKALLERKKWEKVSELINNLDTADDEKIRRAVIGTMSKIVASGKKNDQAELIYMNFKEPFFNNGRAGLVFACYQSLT